MEGPSFLLKAQPPHVNRWELPRLGVRYSRESRRKGVAIPGGEVYPMGQIRDDTVVLQQGPDRLPGAGLALVVRILADRINWGPVVDGLLPWDRDRTHGPPSVLLLTLLMHGLSQRTPLSRVKGWAQGLPLDLCWGPTVTALVFPDEALGRVLEKVADHGPAVVGTLGVWIQALMAEGPQILHSDTPSFSLFGDDARSDPDRDTPPLVSGYRQAHRPDLKQILMGLSTEPLGQMLWGDMLDGNTSDTAWFPAGLETVDRAVPDTAWKPAL